MSLDKKVVQRRAVRKSSDSGVKTYQKRRRQQFPIVCLSLHIIFMILTGIFVRYTPHQAVAPWNPDEIDNALEAEKKYMERDFDDSMSYDPENANNLQFIDYYYPSLFKFTFFIFFQFN